MECPRIVENQMENMDNEMGAGGIQGCKEFTLSHYIEETILTTVYTIMVT